MRSTCRKMFISSISNEKGIFFSSGYYIRDQPVQRPAQAAPRDPPPPAGPLPGGDIGQQGCGGLPVCLHHLQHCRGAPAHWWVLCFVMNFLSYS